MARIASPTSLRPIILGCRRNHTQAPRSASRNQQTHVAGRSAKILICALSILLVTWAHAGGPARVAGVSGFNAGLAGTPITWANGEVHYYTDQGDLSPVLSQADADALVGEAFSRWTSVPTAATSAVRDGQLAEDVNGSNVGRIGATLVMPPDTQAGSTKPVAIIYDADGLVTDALLGAGAGGADLCGTNAVFGGPDSFSEDAHIAHALVVVNGNCAATTADIPVLRYRLVRVLGRVLGLNWSQLNDNVLTGLPVPSADDYAGFPLMHPVDINCGGGSPIGCLPNPDQPRMDDRAAISRLYPVTVANLANFPGKQLFADNTARVTGTVRFADPSGLGMQGANVVARLIDPASGRPSHSAAISCVTGFLFRGNAGNAVTGYFRGPGERFDHFGSDDLALEGWFDLAGLELPAGSSTARYQLSVEPVNPLYDGETAVGPYRDGVVALSGAAAPITVTINKGQETIQDITMSASAAETADEREPSSYAAPAPMPGGGDWIASLSPYGDHDYYWLSARADRTATIEITAVNETNVPTSDKAQPAIGIWTESNAEGSSPAVMQMPFNATSRGMTRLEAQFNAGGQYRLGIADFRGDGRPDFRYHARLLYGDTVSPARVGVLGGSTVAITGLGFHAGMTVIIGSAEAPVVSATSSQLQVTVPALSDGVRTIVISDPITGATSTMTNALTSGAALTDKLELVFGANPGVPVGTLAPNPIRVRVVDVNNGPVAGASVHFSASPANALLFSPCNAAACTIVSDGTGEASTTVTVQQEGVITVTAALPSGVNVGTTVLGIAATTSISALTPKYWAAAHASLSLPLTARVLENGTAAGGRTVNYQIISGDAALSAPSAVTDSQGAATASLSIVDLRSEVQVSACLSPSNAPCTSFTIFAVPAESIILEKLAGDQQVVAVGNPVQAVTVRVRDSSSPPNPVLGAVVHFLVTAVKPRIDSRSVVGEVVTTHPAQPILVSLSEFSAPSDAAGSASLLPELKPEWGALVVSVTVSAGNAQASFDLQVVEPPANLRREDLTTATRVRRGNEIVVVSTRQAPAPVQSGAVPRDRTSSVLKKLRKSR